MTRLATILLAGLVVGCPRAEPRTAAPEPVRVVILHTNDTHGAIWGSGRAGNVAQRATLVERAREEADRDGAVVLLVDAGDVRTGTYCSDRHRARPDLEAMAAMGYDAMALGNHELDVPLAEALAQASALAFPVLGANVLSRETAEPLLRPSVVVERGGLRIALLGVTTPELARTSTFGAAAAIRVEDPVETAARLVPDLARAADLVVVLSHLGLDEDRRLAAAVPGIDVIVGGHSHDAIEPPESAGRTTIVQAGAEGRFLGRLELELGPAGPRVVSGRLLPVSQDLPEHPRLAALLARHDCPEEREVLGRAEAAVTRAPVAGPGSSSALSNLVGEAFRAESGAEVALLNRGGLRADLPSGEVTLGRIHAVMPFTNVLVVLGARGPDLEELARSVAARGPRGRGVLLPSGMDWVLGPGDEVAVTVAGEELDRDRVYELVVSDFLSGGGDGHARVSGLPVLRELETGPREALAAHVRRLGTVRPDRTVRLRWVAAGAALAPARDGRAPSLPLGPPLAVDLAAPGRAAHALLVSSRR